MGAAQTASTQSIPDLGDSLAMSPAAERKLGDGAARSMYRDPDYLEDAVLQDYVDGVLARLLVSARARGEVSPEMDDAYAWRVLLGRSRVVNAFATPGGYFGLQLGLLGVTASSDELAAVMAHELSHVSQRHLARMFERQSAQTPWVVGAMILGMLAAAQSGNAGNIGSAVAVGGSAASAQAQLNFSRDMEREADRIGMGVSAQAGYAPQAFVSMFDKLYQANRLNDSGSFPLLRTHPLTTERMSDMQSRLGAGDLAPLATAATKPSNTEHALMAARASVLSATSADARQLLLDKGRLANGKSERSAAEHYAAALAAIQLRDIDAAAQQLQALKAVLDALTPTQEASASASAQKQWRYLRAEWALASQRPQEIAQIGPLLAADASERAGLWLLGQVLLAEKTPDAAMADSLRAALAQRRAYLVLLPDDALLWQQQAQLAQAAGQPLVALRAQAERSAAQLDTAQALERMKAAQTWAYQHPASSAADQQEASIIDSRVRQLQGQLKELQASKM